MRMNNTGSVFRCFVAIALFASPAFAQAPPTARDVINKMARVYAQSETYRDEGKVAYRDGRVWSFTTVFQRPTLFKFEYTGPFPSRHFVLWRTAPGDVRMWSTLKPQGQLKPMAMAIASFTGVSGTSSHTIPVLLMPNEVSGFSLSSDWMAPAPPEEALVDGHACYKISGHYLTGVDQMLSVWVDKETFLIRKVVDEYQTTTYSPQIDIAIDAALFDFKTPAGNPSR